MSFLGTQAQGRFLEGLEYDISHGFGVQELGTKDRKPQTARQNAPKLDDSSLVPNWLATPLYLGHIFLAPPESNCPSFRPYHLQEAIIMDGHM